MSEIILTNEQKECINKCYENIHSTLLDKSLTICDCCDPYNGHEYIDMGDDGIWAKYPIGITEWNSESLNDILYFTWGGIEGHKASEVESGNVIFNGDLDRFCGTPGYTYNGYGQQYAATKYCSDSEYGKDGFTDEFTILLPEDDACVQNMGGNWRMPTIEEIQNLHNKCNTEWVTNYIGLSGLNGWLFKLKTDESKQLFFPASGSCGGGLVHSVGSYGHFWSSSLCIPSPYIGYVLYFNSDSISSRYSHVRYEGVPIVGILDSN